MEPGVFDLKHQIHSKGTCQPHCQLYAAQYNFQGTFRVWQFIPNEYESSCFTVDRLSTSPEVLRNLSMFMSPIAFQTFLARLYPIAPGALAQCYFMLSTLGLFLPRE